MKKLFLVFLALSFLASASNAQLFIGARASGMGGAGVSTSYDLSSAYYNPAGLMKASTFGFQGSLAAAYESLDKLTSAIGAASNSSQYISENFAKELSLDSNLWGLVGGNFNKVGVSIIPLLNVNVQKPASSLAANGSVSGIHSTAVTMGKTFSLAMLPELHVGANLKYIGGVNGGISVLVNPITGAGSGAKTVANSSGFGLDLGALTYFEVPYVSSLAVGVVARDLMQSITTSTKRTPLTVNPGSSSFVEGAEQDLGSSTSTADPSYAIGASAVLPGIGLLMAGDLETGNGYSNTHIGFEYPMILNVVALRAGVASGTNISYTTIGAKLGLPFFAVNTALIFDNKIQNNNSIVLDFGAAL